TVNPQQIFWFSQKQSANWRNEDDPEDLALDSDYAGRVSSSHTGFSSTLTITDLRETDSGDYHLVIITGGGERRRGSAVRLTVSGDDAAAQDALHSPSVEHGEDWRRKMRFPQSPQEVEALLGFLGYGAGVEGPREVLRDVDAEELCALDYFHSRAIDVQMGGVASHSSKVNNHLFSFEGGCWFCTDLQVTMSHVTQTALRMTCSTSCSVTPEPLYLWYKNGQREEARSKRQIDLVSSSVPCSVSCSAATHSSEVRSSSVCVFGEDCWNVSYSDRRLCVLEGSSVDVLCTYSHPSTHTVTKVFWYYSDPNGKLKDLRVEERFAGRVEFLGGKEGNCSLRMRDVRKSDSGEYRFRFITNTAGGEFSGTPGVVLKVTDLQVRASPSSPPEGQTVTLTCTSTCTLPNNPTYIWYKSGEPVTNKPTKSNKLYLESASSEELRQYSCALGDRGQNDTPTTPTPTTPTPTTPTTSNPNTGLTPEGKGDGAVLKPIMAAVGVCLALILVPVSVWIWRRKSSSAKDPRSTEDSGQCDEALDTQEDLHYSTVHFRPSHSADESPSTTSTLPLDDTDVQYADVKFSRRGAAT
ncbi:hypothetical protein NFI96_012190, partial [Prochilodus magdalenae]